ncbi:MAG: hypothetical protein M9899_08735 [Bdellovibrionaceae bacterium]|nr:hypothetical protein [Pseudobdellovibrionaceae bacterium]
MKQGYQKDDFLDLLDELSDTLTVSDLEFDMAGARPAAHSRAASAPPIYAETSHYRQSRAGTLDSRHTSPQTVSRDSHYAQSQAVSQNSQRVPARAGSVGVGPMNAQLERQNVLLQNKNAKMLEEYTRLFRSYRKQEQELQSKAQQIQKLVTELNSKSSADTKKTQAVNDIVQKLKKINDQYKAENFRLKHQEEKIKKTLAQMEQEGLAVKDQSQKIKAENDRLTVLTKNLSEEIKQIAAHKQSYVDEVRGLQKKHSEQLRLIEEQKQSLVKLGTELKTKATEGAELHQKHLVLREQNKTLTTNFDEQRRELASFKTQNDELQRVLKECKTVIEKQKDRIAGEVKFIQKIDALNAEVAKNKKEIERHLQRVFTLEKELKSMTAAKQELEEQLMQTVAQKNTEIQERIRMYTEVVKRLQDLEIQFDEKTKQIVFLNNANETLTETIYQQKSELDNAQLAIQKEVDEKAQALALIERLKEHVQKLSDSRKTQQHKIVLLEENLKHETATMKSYQENMVEVEQTLADNAEQIQEQKQTIEQHILELAELKGTKEDLTHQVTKLKKIEQELNYNFEELKLAHKDAVREKQTLEKRAEHLETKVEHLKDVGSRASQSLAEMQKELSAEQMKSRKLEKELVALQAKVAHFDEDKKKILAENHILKADVETANHSARAAQSMAKEVAMKVKEYLQREKEYMARESKLVDYRSWLDANKGFIAEQVEECMGVIRQTLNLNPMTEFLKSLNAEISKLDELLASPNVFGSIRAHYEELRTKLDEQRQVSEKLLSSYSQEVEVNTQKLEMALQHQDFWEAPPLPPKDQAINKNQEDAPKETPVTVEV